MAFLLGHGYGLIDVSGHRCVDLCLSDGEDSATSPSSTTFLKLEAMWENKNWELNREEI